MSSLTGFYSYKKDSSKSDFNEMISRLSHRGILKSKHFDNKFSLAAMNSYNLDDAWYSQKNDLYTALCGKIDNCDKDNQAEFLLDLFSKKQIGAFSEISGFFACVIVDRKRQEVILYRPENSYIPLCYYYSPIDNTLVFASEVKSIFANRLVDPDYEWSSFIDYNVTSYPQRNKTFFKNVFNAYPGEAVIVNKNGLILKNISISHYLSYKNEEDVINNFSELVLDGINTNLPDDKKIAVLFSGGVDSTVLTYACKKFKKKYSFYSLVNDLDFHYAKFASDKYKFNGHWIDPAEYDFKKIFPKFIHAIEYFGYDMCGQYFLSYYAKKDDATIIATGFGPDQLLSTRGRINGAEIKERISIAVDNLRVKGISEEMLVDFVIMMEEAAATPDYFARNWVRHRNFYTIMWLFDRAISDFGCSFVSPFLDMKIIDFIKGLHDSFLFRNNEQKWIFKKAAKKMGIDSQIVFRKKSPGDKRILSFSIAQIDDYFNNLITDEDIKKDPYSIFYYGYPQKRSNIKTLVGIKKMMDYFFIKNRGLYNNESIEDILFSS